MEASCKNTLRNEQDFSRGSATFKLPVRFGGFTERKRFSDSQFQLACADPLENIRCTP
jgi:hypothetical protein